jgi:hypothetical protein
VPLSQDGLLEFAVMRPAKSRYDCLEKNRLLERRLALMPGSQFRGNSDDCLSNIRGFDLGHPVSRRLTLGFSRGAS